MYRLIQIVALAGTVSVIGCGATQRATPITTTPPAGPTEVNASQRGVVPAGQELDVRLQTPLSSETATREMRFETVTAAAVTQDGNVLIPAGSRVRGVVTDVKRPGRVDRVGSLTLSFDQIEVRGRTYPVRGMTQACVCLGRLVLVGAHLRYQIDQPLHFFLETIDGVEFSLGGTRCCRLDHSRRFLLRS